MVWCKTGVTINYCTLPVMIFLDNKIFPSNLNSKFNTWIYVSLCSKVKMLNLIFLRNLKSFRMVGIIIGSLRICMTRNESIDSILR